MELFVILSLCPMIVWDFRHRRILLWQLLLFGILQFALSLWRLGWEIMIQNLTTNVLILFVIGTVLWIYIRIRFGRKAVIGMGDIVFVFLLSPCFDSRHFLYFLIISSLLTLGGWLVYCCFSRVESKEIPLVAALGICYFLLLTYQGVTILW